MPRRGSMSARVPVRADDAGRAERAGAAPRDLAPASWGRGRSVRRTRGSR